ncbi:MAG: segregation and condensation protein A [Exilispira sp.]
MEQLIYVIDNVFEGPIELLIFLVKEKKVSIVDIPLIFIANQFYDYFQRVNKIPLESTGNFISILSELVNIKSRYLIKKEEEIELLEEKENFFNHPDPEKLVEYKSIKEAFDKFCDIDEKNSLPIFTKSQMQIIIDEDEKWEAISIIDLFKHFESIISKIPEQKDFIISRSTITVEEMIEKIKDLLKQNEFLLFSHIIVQYNSRVEFICLFLAILELVKSKYIKIYQIDQFTDIKITRI